MFQNFPSTGLVSQFFTVTFSLQNVILVSPVEGGCVVVWEV